MSGQKPVMRYHIYRSKPHGNTGEKGLERLLEEPFVQIAMSQNLVVMCVCRVFTRGGTDKPARRSTFLWAGILITFCHVLTTVSRLIGGGGGGGTISLHQPLNPS